MDITKQSSLRLKDNTWKSLISSNNAKQSISNPQTNSADCLPGVNWRGVNWRRRRSGTSRSGTCGSAACRTGRQACWIRPGERNACCWADGKSRSACCWADGKNRSAWRRHLRRRNLRRCLCRQMAWWWLQRRPRGHLGACAHDGLLQGGSVHKASGSAGVIHG